MLSKLIVPLIIVMSCAIAYLGDYLGRRLGKKRLTLFGLRPKHTAILITVLTGMFIATATLGSVMTVDQDVRNALWAFSQVKDDLAQAQRDSSNWQMRAARARSQAALDEDALRSSRERLGLAKQQEARAVGREQAAEEKLNRVEVQLTVDTRAIGQLSARKSQLESENLGLRGQNKQQQTQLVAANDRLGNLQDIQTRLATDNGALERQKSQLQLEVKRALTDRTLAEQRRDQVKGDLALSNSRLQEVQGLYDDTKLKFDETKRSLNEVDRKLLEKTTEAHELDRQNQDLRSSNSRLASNNVGLQATNDALVLANQQAQIGLSDAYKLRDDAIQAANKATAAATDYFTQWRDSTHKEIVFEPDQLIFQDLVRGDISPDEVRRSLDGVLNNAEELAAKAGSGDPDNSGRKLRLMDPANPLQPHEEVVASLLKNLSQQSGYVVLRIQAMRRFFAGEQAVAAAYLIPNRMIYARGQILGIADLDGRQSEREIRDRLFTYLSQDIGPRAQQDGLLPDAHNQVSTDMLDKVLALSRHIHEIHHPVQVQILAAQDTWCSQPLDLVFKVLSAGP